MVWLFTFGFGVVSAAMLFLHKVLVPGGMFTLMRALPPLRIHTNSAGGSIKSPTGAVPMERAIV